MNIEMQVEYKTEDVLELIKADFQYRFKNTIPRGYEVIAEERYSTFRVKIREIPEPEPEPREPIPEPAEVDLSE